MIPSIFHLGPLAVNSFGLMLVMGLLSGWRTLEMSLQRAKEDPLLAETLVFAAGLGGVLGARLLYLASNPSFVFNDPLSAIFSGAGFVFYGGLIGGAFGVWLVLRKRGLPFFRFADIVAPSLAIGYAVGRLGCHLSGDGDYGIETAMPWGFRYSLGIVPTPPGMLVHPTPVYETLMGLAIAAILLRQQRRANEQELGTGRIFGIYLILSSVARFLVEIIRIEPIVGFGLTEAQLISIVLVIIGTLLLLMPRKRFS